MKVGTGCLANARAVVGCISQNDRAFRHTLRRRLADPPLLLGSLITGWSDDDEYAFLPVVLVKWRSVGAAGHDDRRK
jgi:hypothetical protein